MLFRFNCYNLSSCRLFPDIPWLLHRYRADSMIGLTHLPLVQHVCVNERVKHWYRWFVACSAPSHYLNQYWLFVNWTPGNNFRIEILSFSFKKMHLKLSSADMAANWSTERWVKVVHQSRKILWVNLQTQRRVLPYHSSVVHWTLNERENQMYPLIRKVHSIVGIEHVNHHLTQDLLFTASIVSPRPGSHCDFEQRVHEYVHISA